MSASLSLSSSSFKFSSLSRITVSSAPITEAYIVIMQKNFNIRSHKRKNTNINMEFAAVSTPAMKEIEGRITLFWQSIYASSI
jgi:hypothetical protein